MEDFKVTQQHVIDDINNNTESWFGKAPTRPADLWEELIDSPWLLELNLYELIKEFDEVRSRLTATHNLIARGYEQNDYSLIQLETDTGLEYEYDYYRDILKAFKLGYNINIEYSFNDVQLF